MLGTMAVDGTVGLNTNGTGAATIVNDAGMKFCSFDSGWGIECNSYDGRYYR